MCSGSKDLDFHFLAENPRNIEKITYLYFFRLVKLQNVPFVYTMHLTLTVERLRLPFLKSTQYKKLAPNVLRFTYQNLKSCKSHDFTNRFSILMFFVFFSFFMWFAIFQILICEPQYIWHKFLVLS